MKRLFFTILILGLMNTQVLFSDSSFHNRNMNWLMGDSSTSDIKTKQKSKKFKKDTDIYAEYDGFHQNTKGCIIEYVKNDETMQRVYLNLKKVQGFEAVTTKRSPGFKIYTDDGKIIHLNAGPYQTEEVSNAFSMCADSTTKKVKVKADMSRDGAGVVTDSVTTLQWQDDYSDNGDVIKHTNWKGAINYCENELSLGEYSDWRLPNINELKSIVENSKSNPSIDDSVNGFQNTSTSYNYWSSTTYASDTSSAWYVYFGDGHSYYFNKSRNNFVRCVRSGQ